MTQLAPGTTGPDVVIEEDEIVKIDDNGNEQDQAAEDEESIILNMIQAYKEADAPPQTSDTPCQICATQGEASVGEQTTDTEIMNTVALLSLSCPAPAEMVLSLEMSQQLGPAPGTMPNLEQNLHESTSLSKQVDLDCLRDKSGQRS